MQVSPENNTASFVNLGFENSVTDPLSEELIYYNTGHDLIGKMVLCPPFIGGSGKVAKIVGFCPDEEVEKEDEDEDEDEESKNEEVEEEEEEEESKVSERSERA